LAPEGDGHLDFDAGPRMRATSKTAGEPHEGLLMIASADGEPLYAIEGQASGVKLTSQGGSRFAGSNGSIGLVIFRRGDEMYAT